MSDKVNHPDHYQAGRYECIDVIEDLGLGEGFNIGNAIKYLWRAGKKPDSDTLDDLRKARWYIEREIRRLEANHGDQEDHGDQEEKCIVRHESLKELDLTRRYASGTAHTRCTSSDYAVVRRG